MFWNEARGRPRCSVLISLLGTFVSVPGVLIWGITTGGMSIAGISSLVNWGIVIGAPLSALAAAGVARGKGQGYVGWILCGLLPGGFLLGPVVLVHALLLPSPPRREPCPE